MVTSPSNTSSADYLADRLGSPDASLAFEVYFRSFFELPVFLPLLALCSLLPRLEVGGLPVSASAFIISLLLLPALLIKVSLR